MCYLICYHIIWNWPVKVSPPSFQIFFGASDLILHQNDEYYEAEVDSEIVGAGAVMAFTVITPLILLAYVLEGREAVQRTSLDALLCFIAAGMLIAAGGGLTLL